MAEKKAAGKRAPAGGPRKSAGPAAKAADGESDVLANIAEMPAPDRALGERLHAIITASRPGPVAETLVRHAGVRQ